MNPSLIKRLGLGTVQFGLDYGISNNTGQMSRGEVFDVLDYAGNAGLDLLDTSMAYGASEEIIGSYKAERPHQFKIITKWVGADGFPNDRRENVFLRSLDKLKTSSLYGLLVHSFKEFRQYPEIWEMMCDFKDSGSVQKIGFSLYHPEDLEYLLNTGVAFDLVQVPLSVFDKRFQLYFEELRGRGVEIHARSVFLQGLIFLDSKELPDFFNTVKPALKKIQAISLRENIPLAALCLNHALSNTLVDRVIIGVESQKTLKQNIENLHYFKTVESLYHELEDLAIDDEAILLPYQWPKKTSLNK